MNKQLLKENTVATHNIAATIGEEFKPILCERYCDNGDFSHYELIDNRDGSILWTEAIEDAKIEMEDKPMLRHCVDNDGDLRFFYEKMDRIIGVLYKDGNLVIANTDQRKWNHTEWSKNGAIVDTECVSEFNGGRYKISDTGVLYREDTKGGYIVSITGLFSYFNCSDENLKRDSHGCAIINGG